MTFGVWSILARSLVSAAIFDALVPLSPFITRSMDVDASAFQAILALGMLGFSVSQIFSGSLISFIGLQRALAISTFAVSLLCAAMTVFSTFRLFSLALILIFLVNAIASVSTRAMLRNQVDHDAFQKLTAFTYAAMSVVSVAIPLVIVTLANAVDWRWPILLFASLLLGVSAAIWLSPYADEDTKDISGLSPSGTTRRLLKNPSFISGLIVAFSSQAAFTYLMVSKPFILQDYFLLPTTTWGPILSGMAAVTAIGFYVSGKLVKNFSEYSRFLTGMLLQLSAALALWLTYLFPNLSLFILGTIFSSLSLCVLLPLASGWSLDVAVADRVYASALFGIMQGSATAIVLLGGSFIAIPLLLKISLIATLCALATISSLWVRNLAVSGKLNVDLI